MIVKITSKEWYPVYYIKKNPYSYHSYNMSEDDIAKLKELMHIRNQANNDIHNIIDKYDCLD